MAPSLAVRKEADWKHMSVAAPALWAIDMHFTEPSTFRIRCCGERSRSFLCSLMLDYKTRGVTVPSYRKAFDLNLLSACDVWITLSGT